MTNHSDYEGGSIPWLLTNVLEWGVVKERDKDISGELEKVDDKRREMGMKEDKRDEDKES